MIQQWLNPHFMHIIRLEWVGLVLPIALLPMTLMGCQKLEQINLKKPITNASAPMTASATVATTTPTASSNPSNQHTDPNALPVVYPIAQWQQQSVTSKIGVQDIEGIKSRLGQPIMIDEKSLDYRSNIATKYRFAKIAEPYLDLLDSASYLELQWYFADKNDNTTIKNISINHAKKVFELTQNWFGNDGAGIVANMVQGQPIQNKSYQGIVVELARCENYHCSLVIKKPAANPQKRPSSKQPTTPQHVIR